MARKERLIIDGMNFFRRMLYVGQLSTKRGYPTGVTFAVARMLRKALCEWSVDDLVWCWEGRDGIAWRRQLYAPYKANRAHEEQNEILRESARVQLDDVRRLLCGFGITQLEAASLEADDVIGLLCTRFSCDNVQNTILSTDKDFLQLLSPTCRMLSDTAANGHGYSFEHKNGAIVDESKAIIAPSPQIMLWQRAAIGDVSDNIQGIAGLGAKRAAQIFDDVPKKGQGLAQYLKERAGTLRRTKHGQALLDNFADVTRNLTLMQLGASLNDVNRDAYTRGARVIAMQLSAYGDPKNYQRMLGNAPYAVASKATTQLERTALSRFFVRRELNSFSTSDILELKNAVQRMHARRAAVWNTLVAAKKLPKSLHESVLGAVVRDVSKRAPALTEIGALDIPDALRVDEEGAA